GMTNAFNLLDNMDGLAATLAGIAFGFFAIDAVTVHPDDAHLAFALAGACACAGFLPFNLRPGRKALVFMGDSGAQVLGFALASLGLAASWNVAGSTVATLLLPILILAVPVLDTTLVTTIRLLEGRPVSQGGLDDQRLAIVGVLVTFVLLVQFASFLADVERRTAPGSDVRLVDTFAVHWRRLIEVLVDFGLIVGSFAAAYVVRFGWPGTESQRHLATVALPVLIAARYLAFIPFGLYRSIWRYAGSRDLVSIAAAVTVSEVAGLAYISLNYPFGDF